MHEEIFRKKSMDKVKSPESLDDYIRVSNPGVWLLLVSVIVLLIGACVWGIFGHADSEIAVSLKREEGTAVCYVAKEDIASLKAGMTVRFGSGEAKIAAIGEETEFGYRCTLSDAVDLPEGEGPIAGTVTYHPMSFILNY